MWYLSEHCPTFPQHSGRDINAILKSLAGTNEYGLSHYFDIKDSDPQNAHLLLAEVLTQGLTEFSDFCKLGNPQWQDIKELGGERAVALAERWLEAKCMNTRKLADTLFADLGMVLADAAHYSLAQQGMQEESHLLRHMVENVRKNASISSRFNFARKFQLFSNAGNRVLEESL